jgi:hypothetical protein
VIEENGERRHAAPTPNELGIGQEEKDKVVTAECQFVLQSRFPLSVPVWSELLNYPTDVVAFFLIDRVI